MLFRRQLKEILVFVSSPGDCVRERELSTNLIEKINAHPAVVRQKLRFRAVLWEELPPGIAVDGKFQIRINSMMRRLGYDEYGVYLGFMKGRVGTPTSSHVSGTVEELENSLEGQQNRGSPSEVLFYFLEPEASRNPDVSALRERLGARHVLYASVEEQTFESQLGRNLTEIFTTWNSWPMRLSRFRRRLRQVVIIVLFVLLVAALGIDLIARFRVSSELEAGRLENASAVWYDFRQLIPISRRSLQHDINEKLLHHLNQSSDIASKLDEFQRIQSLRAYIPDRFTDYQWIMAADVIAFIDGAIIRDTNASDVALFRQALDVGLFQADKTSAESLLQDLSGVRLISALAKSQVPVTSWDGVLLRPPELSRLRQLARKVIAASPHLENIGDRHIRTAFAHLAEDSNLMKALATAAIQIDSLEQPELRALLGSATPEVARDWLLGANLSELPLHVLAPIVDTAIDRRDAISKLALLGLYVSGELSRDSASLFELFSCDTANCGSQAVALLLRWSADASIDIDRLRLALERLLPYTNVDTLTLDQRRTIAQRVIELAADDIYTPSSIEWLSRLALPETTALLEQLIDKHVRREISFGFLNREALLVHLSGQPIDSAHLSDARRIVRNSEVDQQLVQGTQLGGELLASGLKAIDTGYLRVLQKNFKLMQPEDTELLSDIIDRVVANSRQHGLAVFIPHLTDHEAMLVPLGKVLIDVSESVFYSLLELPALPEIDSAASVRWTRREVMLQSLAAVGTLPPDRFSRLVASLPDDPDIINKIIIPLQTVSPAVAIDHYHRQIELGKYEGVIQLAAMGHQGELLILLRDPAFSGYAERNSIVKDTVAETGQGDRRAFIGALLDQEPSLADTLLVAAADAAVKRPELDTQAEQVLLNVRESDADVNKLLPGIRYLSNTGNLWAFMTREDNLPYWQRWLAFADTFSWIGLAQELNLPTSSISQSAVSTLAAAQPALVVIDESGLPSSAEDGWLVLNPNTKVKNHLVYLLGRFSRTSLVLDTLQTLWLQASSDGVALLGSVPNAAIVFKSYLTWIAADSKGLPEKDCPASLYGLPELDSANLHVQRSAAIWTIRQGFRCSEYTAWQ